MSLSLLTTLLTLLLGASSPLLAIISALTGHGSSSTAHPVTGTTPTTTNPPSTGNPLADLLNGGLGGNNAMNGLLPLLLGSLLGKTTSTASDGSTTSSLNTSGLNPIELILLMLLTGIGSPAPASTTGGTTPTPTPAPLPTPTPAPTPSPAKAEDTDK